MKSLIILLLCLFSFSIINAQQLKVINSAGNQLENNAGSIVFTIGEVVIGSFTNGNLTLTQGFLQSDLTVTAVTEIPGIDYELLAYPNPTKDFVILKINKDDLSDFKFNLYDLSGKFIETKQINSPETIIPFHFLRPTTYILKIYENQIEVKTFKIIKSN